MSWESFFAGGIAAVCLWEGLKLLARAKRAAVLRPVERLDFQRLAITNLKNGEKKREVK